MIIKDIEKILRGFLWCQGDLKKGKAKVKWNDVCVPKDEGGLGSGSSTSAYFDKWYLEGPFSETVTPRDMATVGLSLNACVHDMILSFNGNWPHEWVAKYPLLQNVSLPSVQGGNDQIHWRGNDGALVPFSTAHVWNAIRPTGNIVSWFSVVWFSQCIPRHAFLLWLVMGERLKTHDKMKP
ncbi:uncharacterized protein [Rutidosis leptorrhynchoides]|uniref:uncharacterized protein n=1 Tax=Rutidosis leptorrhynchoides TaxID=125765 RepID=UPI003A991656